MTVFVLFREAAWDVDEYVLGVYSTLERAKAAADVSEWESRPDGPKTEWRGWGVTAVGLQYGWSRVEEFVVDQLYGESE